MKLFRKNIKTNGFEITLSNNEESISIEVFDNKNLSKKYVINKRELLARPDLSDYALYGLTDDGLILNIFSATQQTRCSMRSLFENINRSLLMALAIPSMGDMDSAYVVIYCSDADVIHLNGFEDCGGIDNLSEHLPSIEFNNVTRDGDLMRFEVTCSFDGEIKSYLSATCGALLTPQVVIKNGVGMGLISLAGLPSGMCGKLKAGFKYYSALASLEYVV